MVAWASAFWLVDIRSSYDVLETSVTHSPFTCSLALPRLRLQRHERHYQRWEDATLPPVKTLYKFL
eukprot:1766307-Amphidinium_carterae.3